MNKIQNLIRLYGLNAGKGAAFKAEANTIYIYDVIVGSDFEAEYFGGVAPRPFIDALKGMSGDVHLRINSPGGDVFGANAMAQAMREYKGGQIIAHVDGVAASAASVLAVTANQTVMAPGSLLMIHNAWTIAGGDRHDFTDTASLLEKVDGMLAETYAKKAGRTAAEFAAMMDAETWFTPQEALDTALATSIADDNQPAAKAAWDLSIFAKAPQAAAPTVIRTTTVTETTCVETEVETETVEVISGDPASAPADMAAQAIEARKRQHAAAMLRKTA